MREVYEMMNNNNIKLFKRSLMEYCLWTPERDIYVEDKVVTIVYGDDGCRTRFVALSDEESNKLKARLEEMIHSR